jgi:hypothetical protein
MVLPRIYAVSFALMTLLSLSACSNSGGGSGTPVFSAQSMPKGYTYQDDTPLSSPQPSSPWKKSAEISNTENIGAQNAAWQGAVFELVDKMDPNLPKDGTPINLSPEEYSIMDGAIDNAFDHYLRQAFIQKGYNLTSIPDAGLQITYKTETAKTPRTYNLTTSILDKEGKPALVTTIPAVLHQ